MFDIRGKFIYGDGCIACHAYGCLCGCEWLVLLPTGKCHSTNLHFNCILVKTLSAFALHVSAKLKSCQESFTADVHAKCSDTVKSDASVYSASVLVMAISP